MSGGSPQREKEEEWEIDIFGAKERRVVRWVGIALPAKSGERVREERGRGAAESRLMHNSKGGNKLKCEVTAWHW